MQLREESPVSQAQPVDQSTSTINILVFGPTGAGKSTIVNLLTNDSANLPVGESLASCTDQVAEASIRHNGRTITFFDTPGFGDSRLNPAEHLMKIAAPLSFKYGEKEKRQPYIHGVLYIHNIADSRISESALKNLEVFRNLIGPHMFKNIVFVTNMWRDPPKDMHTRREQELIATPEYFGNFVRAGARAGHKYRVLEDSDSARVQETLLDLFSEYEPQVTQIQKDMVDSSQQLQNTAAGRIVNKELETSKELEEIRIRALQKELADSKASLQTNRAELEKEINAHRETVRKIQAQKTFLQIDYKTCKLVVSQMGLKGSLLCMIGGLMVAWGLSLSAEVMLVLTAALKAIL